MQQAWESRLGRGKRKRTRDCATAGLGRLVPRAHNASLQVLAAVVCTASRTEPVTCTPRTVFHALHPDSIKMLAA
ncbi:hypothetical protein E2C01_072067 [Portunus trituberculatus]|uniref:Uncharacterized protein n=1 Tax=Portunus trituberculatus TaxID=210409 RepID=A0A5B7I6S9_PORTR|nr:hypothetical protein [Portunus trituberculatus]